MENLLFPLTFGRVGIVAVVIVGQNDFVAIVGGGAEVKSAFQVDRLIGADLLLVGKLVTFATGWQWHPVHSCQNLVTSPNSLDSRGEA